MKLAELEPMFVKLSGIDGSYEILDSIEGAQGLQFLCPVCFVKNNGSVGTHSMLCWTPEVPLTVTPGPGRWALHGKGLEDLTLVGHPTSSVKLEAGCFAHFHIEKGEVRIVP
jgi:hypothetical protein